MDSVPTADSEDLTVVFIDLVRFTSLTEVHGDVAGADAAAALTEVVKANSADGVYLVKTLGDGVLLAARSPEDALKSAAAAVEGLHDLARGIDARVGADQGPVLARDGDVFGSTVNLAARLATLARPGRIVCTRPIVAGDVALELAAVPLGERPVRGFLAPVELFEIDPCDHDGAWIVDPVCGMRLAMEKVRDRRIGDAGEVGFCSSRCAEIYDASPEQFV